MSSAAAPAEVDKTTKENKVATKTEAVVWAQHLGTATSKDEDAFLQAWSANFETLKKINKHHVDKKAGDEKAKKAAEKVLVKQVVKCLGGASGTRDVSSSSSEPVRAATPSKSKRKGSKSSAPVDAVAGAESVVAAPLSGSPRTGSSPLAVRSAKDSESPKNVSILSSSPSADGSLAVTSSPKKHRHTKDGEEKPKKKKKKVLPVWEKTSLASSQLVFTEEEYRKSLKRVVEADGTLVKSNVDLWFLNWGANVRNQPNVTFEPTSRTGVQNIVMWARKHNKRVRGCGYRHTWSDMYSEKDQVLVSMIPVSIGTDHQVLAHDDITWNEDDLEGIKIVKVVTGEHGHRVAHCKIGASTTNEQFRRWCLRKGEGGGNWEWTIPLNVIMVEITYGGSNAPICHGAGLRNPTLSDLVVEIEFVNPKGLIQRVNDPEQLRAASGAFGLLGIVTAVTLKLDPMTYAHMMPTKTPVQESVPPPDGFAVPHDLQPRKPYKPKDVQAHVAAFEKHCAEDYYSEWFWFPFQEKTWNNCWNSTTEGKHSAKPMSELSTITQGLQGILGQAFNETLGRFSGRFQTKILSDSAMNALPELKSVQLVPLIDALHFRRGINNMKVLDMELQIPIPDNGKGQPDWTIARRAWWDVIALVYKHRDENKKYPMRVALEMRIMGGSNVIMAPQYGNKHGTCSIEVLTTPEVPAEEWNAFMQEVADIWQGYSADYNDHEGKPIVVRTHWAKQWESLVIDGKPAVDYYRTVAYKDRIPEFLTQLKAIARAGGYKVGDMKERFSTGLLDNLFFK